MLVSMLAVGVIPQTSLAFEVELASAPARKLVAPVRLLHSEDFEREAEVVHEPEYTNRLASSVVAPAPVEVQTASPRSYRLAYKVLPSVGSPVVLEGEASYYSRAGCLGCNAGRIMANGQPLNDQALTMAIGANLKHLVGYRAKVTNLHTNQSVDVLITDTGGFYKAKYGNRVADLTIASKQAIGIHGGVGQVRVEVY